MYVSKTAPTVLQALYLIIAGFVSSTKITRSLPARTLSSTFPDFAQTCFRFQRSASLQLHYVVRIISCRAVLVGREEICASRLTTGGNKRLIFLH